MYELNSRKIEYNMVVPNNDIGMKLFKNRVTYPGRSLEGYMEDQKEYKIEDINYQIDANNISIKKPAYIWRHTKLIADVSPYHKLLQKKCSEITFSNSILIIPVTRRIIELDEWECNILNILPEIITIEKAEKIINEFIKKHGEGCPYNSEKKLILHLERRGIIRFSLNERVEYHTDFINGYYYDYETKPIPHHQIKRPELNNFKISLTEQCSQYCSYCYYTENKKAKRTEMKEEVLYEAIDFIKRISLELKNDKVNISWWGGDPVYADEMLLKGIEYANNVFSNTKISLRHSICSSFIDLDKIENVIKCIKKNNIDVTISCDGPEEIHNKHRVLVDQRKYGSYTVMNQARKSILEDSMSITDKIDMFEKRKWDSRAWHKVKNQYKVKQRCTIYEKDEINNYELLCEYFNQYDQQYRISLATCGDNYENKKLLEEKINNAIKQSCEDIIENYPRSLQRIKNVFLNLHTNPIDGVNYSYSRCGYGGGVVIINTKGDIYSCHRFCDITEYCIGNLKSQTSEIVERCSKLRRRWLCRFEPCINCQNKPYCSGGGCAHEAYCYFGTTEHNAGCISIDMLKNKAVQTYIFNKLYPSTDYEILNLEDGSYARHCWYY